MCVVGDLDSVFVDVCVLELWWTVDVLVDVSGVEEELRTVGLCELLVEGAAEEAALEELIFAGDVDGYTMVEGRHTRRV